MKLAQLIFLLSLTPILILLSFPHTTQADQVFFNNTHPLNCTFITPCDISNASLWNDNIPPSYNSSVVIDTTYDTSSIIFLSVSSNFVYYSLDIAGTVSLTINAGVEGNVSELGIMVGGSLVVTGQLIVHRDADVLIS